MMSLTKEKEALPQLLAQGDHIDAPPVSIYTGYFNGPFDSGEFYVDLGAALRVEAKAIVQLCPVWANNSSAKINSSEAKIDIGQKLLKVTFSVDHPDKLIQVAYTVFIKYGS